MSRKRCLCLLLSLVLCVMPILISTPASFALSRSGLEEQISSLDKEKAELEAKLADAENEKSNALENKQYYDSLVTNTQSQINAASAYSEELSVKISESEKRMSQLDSDIEKEMNEFCENLVASYQNDRISMLQIILSSESLKEFMMNVERSSAILSYRNELARKLNEDLREQSELKAGLETEKEDQAAAQAILEEKEAELVIAQEKASNYLNEASANEEEVRAKLSEAIAAEDALREQLNALVLQEYYEQQRRAAETTVPVTTAPPVTTVPVNPDPEITDAPYTDPPVTDAPTPAPAPTPTPTTDFSWPLRGYTYLTCRFWETDAWGTNPHRGIDIYCPTGTPVYACAAGKVITSQYHYSWGEYILIMHDNGMTTLYAHNSLRLVSAGQRVSAGQMISYSGATGTVTGPHLHLEMQAMVGGSLTLVDPLGYISP